MGIAGIFSDRFGRGKSIIAGAALNLFSTILLIMARNYISSIVMGSIIVVASVISEIRRRIALES
ncbi:hypothetical protein [Kosmotoga pacifica]|uniref:Major facilitator superfamily (MFS) profile domain-containing protein n=2 Tax=Kosmotoga pacifica TaxID=1330330 RepID=A0A0G2Z6F0_9BACT|nr:hypothetical protein [Kosmotoga pacifica]AKI97175.1 hypothetical protein IX53_04400 [Kosmotoga pacifica]